MQRKERYNLYELVDLNRGQIYQDYSDGQETRKSFWALQPYSVGDNLDSINENFVRFVEARNNYMIRRPIFNLMSLAEEYNKAIQHLPKYVEKSKDPHKFVNNLINLQEYLIEQNAYNKDELLLEDVDFDVEPWSLDKKQSDKIANVVAEKKGLSQPRYMEGGGFGFAYDVGNNKVLKITSDVSEANASLKIKAANPEHLVETYNIWKVIDTEENNAYFAILQKHIKDKPIEKFKELHNIFEKIVIASGENLKKIIRTLKRDFNYNEFIEFLNIIFTGAPELNISKQKRKEVYDFMVGIAKISQDLSDLNIKTDDHYLTLGNLGYDNGVLTFFDVGGDFTTMQQQPNIPKQNQITIEEDGSALRSTSDSIGRDDFPTYNSIDTTPSIENNLNANSAMYYEDLEYNHVSNATDDEYVLTEERLEDFSVDDKNFQVFKNPKSLKRLKSNLRAIADKDGNLYVIDDNWYVLHNMFADWLKRNGYPVEDNTYYNLHNTIPLQRLNDTNIFYISESIKKDEIEENKESIILILRRVVEKNPQYNFVLKSIWDSDPYGDTPIFEERKKSWIPGSQAVTVKKKCRIGGLGNTSAACNQGDINNLEFSSLNEIIKDGSYLMYHGSDHKIDKFSDEFVGAEEATDQEGPGIYFTSSYEDAQGYGNYIYSVRLKPRKLVDESPHNDISDRELIKLIKMTPNWKTDAQNWDENPNIGLKLAVDDFFKYNENEKDLFQQVWYDFFRYNPIDFVRGMVKLGYDGQFIKKENNRAHIIVYNPNIIEIENVEKVPLSEKYFRRIGEKKGYTKKAIDEFVKRNFSQKKTKLEGVGDKYLEKKYNIPSEFSSFEKKFDANQLDNKIIHQNEEGWGIVKNPKSFNNIGPDVRGIITKNGDLYVETYSDKIHNKIVDILRQKRIVNTAFQDALEDTLPQEYLSVQRYSNTNKMLVGESNDAMQDDYWMSDNWREDFNIPSKEESEPVFKRFLDAAKMKNPNIEFVNEHIQVHRRNEHGIKESIIVENEIMSLQELPFKTKIEELGGKIYSVGGAVRDEFLGKESKDLDILITGIPFEQLAEIMKPYGKVDAVGKQFGILKFKPKGSSEEIDVAIPRTESVADPEKIKAEIKNLKKNFEVDLHKLSGDDLTHYQDRLNSLQNQLKNSHKRFDVQSDHTLPIEDDLRRRDFTINAIAKDVDGNIVDPFGGQEDLKNKTIKIVNPEAFADDPLRMLRAVQFASRFDFTIEPQTMKMIQENAGKIKEIPPERIITEFDKIVQKGNKRTGAQLLKDTGLFQQIFGFDLKQSTIDRSPFEDVKSMGEFIYLLIRSLPNPAEHYKNELKGDIDTYREIKALDYGMNNITDSAIKNRSVVHNMYLYSPKSLESKILPSELERAANELLMGRFPKTVGELAVNGNDLMQAGFQGKDIGDNLKSLLINVYAENVRNSREELLNLLGKKS